MFGIDHGRDEKPISKKTQTVQCRTFSSGFLNKGL